MLRPYEYNPQKPGFLRLFLSPNQNAHRNPVSCLLTVCGKYKPGLLVIWVSANYYRAE
ncbi:hypothetical protein [Planktothricoides raciborskii]|uniref:Uncharacterized protein n=1 Tax=Planktothricoides raciborskii FACHB-1370 TaxID=2949576 RepID=A0ABR8EBY1_9CYAN|nr:hypothetical protein [Planktothricoides raciborskii]MBD2543673.1 hypothetical protein [Planktothricoides raciborskii FACHB-1370]MBD2582435.1 hypothetical protein [Planktothricoides raciborskii FACHB-1261]